MRCNNLNFPNKMSSFVHMEQNESPIFRIHRSICIHNISIWRSQITLISGKFKWSLHHWIEGRFPQNQLASPCKRLSLGEWNYVTFVPLQSTTPSWHWFCSFDPALQSCIHGRVSKTLTFLRKNDKIIFQNLFTIFQHHGIASGTPPCS